jgi:hypothetical protein
MKINTNNDMNKVLSKFKWLSLNTMQIISEDEHGVEKIIEYDEAKKKFCETSFNVRNMFRQELGESEEDFDNCTYYSNYRKPLEVNNVKGRLIRFCQNYKSNYFLHN